jgi:hypothetical protein
MDLSIDRINQSCWPLMTTSWRYEPTYPRLGPLPGRPMVVMQGMDDVVGSAFPRP